MGIPIEFPDWSDLGLGYLSERMRNSWDYELMLSERYRQYFDGDIFQTKVQTEVLNEDAPLLFPVGINLVKMMCIAQADSMLGEWDDQPIIWGVKRDEDLKSADKDAIALMNNVMDDSNASSLLWEHELERNVYGGAAFKISPVLDSKSHIQWTRVPRQGFFPIWDPDNQDELLEVFSLTYLTLDQAYAKYKFKGERDFVHRLEHWTKTKYENKLDGTSLNDYSGVNPWGVVPFVYTPRFRFSNWYGEPMTPEIIPAQDQLNMTVADMSDAINYNAHPVRWGMNLPKNFDVNNFPLGPNAFWNLGRALGNSPPPQVGILEAKAAIAPGVFDFTKFIYDWSRTSAFAPPIVFGEDPGGGQRSAATLEIRMWPLIKSIRRSRSYLKKGLMRAQYISALILKQKQFPDVPVRMLTSLLESRIVPSFHEILPRDQQVIVDEVVKLLSTQPPTISLETSQGILGRGTGEVDRIKTMIADKALFPPPPLKPKKGAKGSTADSAAELDVSAD